MKHWLVNFGMTVTVGFVVFIFQAEPSFSQTAVVCTNCGTEWTQLMNKAALAQQLANQAQQLQTQISQYQNMLTNSHGFSTQLWGNAMQDINQLNGLMQNSKALAYSAGNLDAQFASRFGTYNNYLSQNMGTAAWQNKYNQWSQQGLDNTLYTLKGLGMQSSQMQNEQALMQQLQTMAGSAEGRMQALQVANMIAAQNVDQIQKLRQLIMMQLQMQANYMATQQDKENAAQAMHDQFFQSTQIPTNDGRRF